jgi:hypothetical protein
MYLCRNVIKLIMMCTVEKLIEMGIHLTTWANIFLLTSHRAQSWAGGCTIGGCCIERGLDFC